MGWLTINPYLQLLCLQLLLLLHPHNSYAKLCPDEQSYALLQFKQLFSYDHNTHSFHCDRLRLLPSYPKMVSWRLDSDCCSWDGVTCDTLTGHVIGLDLDCSWLHGRIPSNTSLFLLPHLQSLNLAFNDFNHSPISSEFAQFHSLTLLNLSSSNFTGQLPSEISHLSKLFSLDLGNNPKVKLETRILEGLVRNLTELEQLVLDSVDMSAIKLGSMANLSNSLISLSLIGCGLQGNFPEKIFCLPNLRKLELAYNQNLTGFFPKENWSNPLRFLDVSLTNFSGTLPDKMSNLKTLTHLILHDCNFIGSIPTSLGNLTQLTHIDLSSNNFSGHIPSSLSNLDQLRYLDFSNNKFIGEIPDIFVHLQQLSYLDFSSNQLVGAIPSHVGGLRNLVTISLENNKLTGHVVEFHNNTSLQSIYLSNNRLHGPIPNSIFELLNLEDLRISSNNLSGLVEFSMFEKLKNLKGLDLSHNSLSIRVTLTNVNHSILDLRLLGLSSCNITEFPGMLRTQHMLYQLDLSDNKIHGQIPDWMWDMGKDTLAILNISHNFLTGIQQLPWNNLRYLDLRFNLLRGLLPLLPPRLRVFFISNNQLTGEMPLSICNMSNIDVLDVANNNLSGTIPECLGNFSNILSVLDLRKNGFHGTIPRTFAKCSSLRTLNLNNNRLEGSVPRSLVNCTRLEVVDLGNNKITDIFPYWLETLPNLQVLVLRSNKFYGSLRGYEGEGGFAKLRIVDLSNNNLAGSLALAKKFFENLEAMMSVDEAQWKLEYMGFSGYQDSILVTIKGNDIEMVKILNVFTTIDFSRNRFHGEIPESIGKLHSLRLLNLSINSLKGDIPSSLGNLTVLESLDLSSNKLVGKIPLQLVSLTFLAVLNLSQNQLEGPIPSGGQFNTFQGNSYGGNSGLCGFPLPRKCSIDETPKPPSTLKDDTTEFENGFGWKPVLMGYGCGAVLGVIIGYLVFLTGKPQCLGRIVERKHCRKVRRPRPKNRDRPIQMKKKFVHCSTF